MILQLVSQVLDSFNNEKFTLGLFIDLSKALDKYAHLKAIVGDVKELNVYHINIFQV